MKYFSVLLADASDIVTSFKLYPVVVDEKRSFYVLDDGTPVTVYPLLEDEHVFDAEFFS